MSNLSYQPITKDDAYFEQLMHYFKDVRAVKVATGTKEAVESIYKSNKTYKDILDGYGGIICEAEKEGGLIVFDCDNVDDLDRELNCSVLEVKHPMIRELRERGLIHTLLIRTPSGGLHAIFRSEGMNLGGSYIKYTYPDGRSAGEMRLSLSYTLAPTRKQVNYEVISMRTPRSISYSTAKDIRDTLVGNLLEDPKEIYKLSQDYKVQDFIPNALEQIMDSQIRVDHGITLEQWKDSYGCKSYLASTALGQEYGYLMRNPFKNYSGSGGLNFGVIPKLNLFYMHSSSYRTGGGVIQFQALGSGYVSLEEYSKNTQLSKEIYSTSKYEATLLVEGSNSKLEDVQYRPDLKQTTIDLSDLPKTREAVEFLQEFMGTEIQSKAITGFLYYLSLICSTDNRFFLGSKGGHRGRTTPNLFFLVLGDTGSGKSWLAGFIDELLDATDHRQNLYGDLTLTSSATTHGVMDFMEARSQSCLKVVVDEMNRTLDPIATKKIMGLLNDFFDCNPSRPIRVGVSSRAMEKNKDKDGINNYYATFMAMERGVSLMNESALGKDTLNRIAVAIELEDEDRRFTSVEVPDKNSGGERVHAIKSTISDSPIFRRFRQFATSMIEATPNRTKIDLPYSETAICYDYPYLSYLYDNFYAEYPRQNEILMKITYLVLLWEGTIDPMSPYPMKLNMELADEAHLFARSVYANTAKILEKYRKLDTKGSEVDDVVYDKRKASLNRIARNRIHKIESLLIYKDEADFEAKYNRVWHLKGTRKAIDFRKEFREGWIPDFYLAMVSDCSKKDFWNDIYPYMSDIANLEKKDIRGYPCLRLIYSKS